VVKYCRFTKKNQSMLCSKHVAGWNSDLIWLEEGRKILLFWKLESVTLLNSHFTYCMDPHFGWCNLKVFLGYVAVKMYTAFLPDYLLIPWPYSTSELYRPSDRPPLVGEVTANFCG
jgi:hypothetical protein